jgi:hypothetical protein
LFFAAEKHEYSCSLLFPSNHTYPFYRLEVLGILDKYLGVGKIIKNKPHISLFLSDIRVDFIDIHTSLEVDALRVD